MYKGQPGQLGEPGPACWAFPNVLLSLFYRSAHSYCHVIPKAAGCWWADLQNKARRCYPVRLQSRYTNHKPLCRCWGIGDLTRQQSSEPSCTAFSQHRHERSRRAGHRSFWNARHCGAAGARPRARGAARGCLQPEPTPGLTATWSLLCWLVFSEFYLQENNAGICLALDVLTVLSLYFNNFLLLSPCQ